VDALLQSDGATLRRKAVRVPGCAGLWQQLDGLKSRDGKMRKLVSKFVNFLLPEVSVGCSFVCLRAIATVPKPRPRTSTYTYAQSRT
jgi:hypothetical protein